MLLSVGCLSIRLYSNVSNVVAEVFLLLIDASSCKAEEAKDEAEVKANGGEDRDESNKVKRKRLPRRRVADPFSSLSARLQIQLHVFLKSVLRPVSVRTVLFGLVRLLKRVNPVLCS